MNQNHNSSLQLHTENISDNKVELQNLGSQLNGKTSFIVQKQAILERHISSLASRNRTWVDRMLLPMEERLTLKGYVEKQSEAVSIILEQQNKSLAALCGGHVTFVKEVVNTILKTGRAGLKAGADLIFMEYRNQRAINMEKLTNEFYHLIERKIADAETRSERLQAMKLREVEIDLRKWEEDYQLLQDEFSNILKEQV